MSPPGPRPSSRSSPRPDAPSKVSPDLGLGVLSGLGNAGGRGNENTPSSAIDPDAALAESLRNSRFIDALYLSFGGLAALFLVAYVAEPEAIPLPPIFPPAAALAVAASLLMPRVPALRSVDGLLAYVIGLECLFLAVAATNGLGLRSPGLMFGPLFLWIIAAVAPWRAGAAACTLFLGGAAMLILRTPELPSGVPGPTVAALMMVVATGLVLASGLGIGFGALLRRHVVRLAEFTQARADGLEARLKAVVETSPYGIVVTRESDQRVVLHNPAYTAQYGLTSEAMLSQPVTALGIWQNLRQRAAIREKLLRNEGTLDELLHLRRADGSPLLVRAAISRLTLDGEEHTLMIGRDVTAEHQRQQMLQAVLDTAPVGIAVIQHGRLVAVGDEFERLMRLGPREAIGQDLERFVGGLAAGQQLTERHNAALRDGTVVSYQHTAHRADGSTFPARFTGRLVSPGAMDGFTMVWLVEDISGQVAHEAALVKAREDALAASQAKSGFLATMSHEIRTPLNGVIGLAELAQDPDLDAPTRAHYLKLLTDSADSLRQLISDVLDISKIESGKLELETLDFDLGEWVEGLQGTFQSLADTKGLRFVVDAPAAHLGLVHGDPTRLRQVLNNYLSNALKFTFQGAITMQVRRLTDRPGRLRISVSDTGIGLSEEARSRLFKPFEQAEASTTRRFGGSGLGLSICQKLAHLMGGDVGVDSEPGQGSTFWIEAELPAVGPVAAADAEAAGQAPAAALAASLAGLRVLLVDDNRINQVVGTRLLQRTGATVRVAADGQEALDAVREAVATGQPFDAVLMDVNMPVMDGLAATRALRADPATRDLPILAATASVMREEVDAAFTAGMDALVPKPFDRQQVVAALRAQVDSRVRPPKG